MDQRLFPSFSAPIRVTVVGATGGVGGAIADLVESAPDVERLVRIGRSGGDLRLDLGSIPAIDKHARYIW